MRETPSTLFLLVPIDGRLGGRSGGARGPAEQARAADARYLKGIVVAPADRPGKPRPIADAVVHVRGAKDTPSTDEDGRFWLILPPEMKPGDALTVDADKEGYRLWSPSGGAARVPTDLDKNLLELQLAPVGSKRFLSPPAIEALVTGMMARAREQIGHDAHAGQIRLDPYLRDWATRYGLSFKEVKAAVDSWAAKVKNNRQSTPAQKSQAAFVRHELADAARFSHAAVTAALAEETGFEKEALALTARKRAHGDAMRELLKKEADADFLSLQFEPALEVYRRVLAQIDKKDDPRAGRPLRSTWPAPSSSSPPGSRARRRCRICNAAPTPAVTPSRSTPASSSPRSGLRPRATSEPSSTTRGSWPPGNRPTSCWRRPRPPSSSRSRCRRASNTPRRGRRPPRT